MLDRAEKVRTFNSSGLDTLVFVHIQKTGGSTLERRFVENIGMLPYSLPAFITILDHHTCDKVRKHKKRNCPRPLVRNLDRNDVQPINPGTWIFRYSVSCLPVLKQLFLVVFQLAGNVVFMLIG